MKISNLTAKIELGNLKAAVCCNCVWEILFNEIKVSTEVTKFPLFQNVDISALWETSSIYLNISTT